VGQPDTVAETPSPFGGGSRRDIASLIQSVYQHFGSGVVVDDYGFALQNRGALFELDAAHPNALGRKVPIRRSFPVHGEGRYHRVRHHGRHESDTGARAVRL
jgi:gamma-glutamyltranspeptidase/glutathione hydrolase